MVSTATATELPARRRKLLRRGGWFVVCAVVAGGIAAPATASGALRGGRSGDAIVEPTAVHVRDGVANHRVALRSVGAASCGGAFTTTSGAVVRMYASAAYRCDATWLQNWANWIDSSLFHSAEINRFTVLFVPELSYFFEVLRDHCGPSADGCYDAASQLLVAPGNNLSDGTVMPTVLAHEYGHHIAANRLNPPWDASTWGPKRWASSVGICRRVSDGTAFPGDQGVHYALNPGEAWAETYRQLIYTSFIWPSAFWPTPPWSIVDQSFFPSAAALAQAKYDVLDPWTPASRSTRTFTGTLTRQRPATTVRFATPNDGDLSVSLFRPIGARLTLLDAAGAIIGSTGSSFSYTVCGQRNFKMRISMRIDDRSSRAYRLRVVAP